MNLYCVKYLMYTKDRNIKKREIERKINLYSRCIDFGLKKFETIDEKEITYLLKA